MKKSIVDVWGFASHNQRVITETTANCLREATTACLDILVQAQHSTGIHKVCAVGGFKDTGSGYSSELRWSEKGDHWWTRQRMFLLRGDHREGYIRVSNSSVYIPWGGLGLDQLTDALAKGLAERYIR